MVPKRVLVIEPSGNLWGSERVLLDFLSSADSKEFEFTICYPPSTPIESELKNLSVSLLPIFQKELHRKSLAEKILSLLKITWALVRQRPDLIYVNQAGATRLVLLSALLLRIPIVSHVRLLEDVRYIASCHYWFFNKLHIVTISNFIYDATKKFVTRPAIRASMIYDLYIPHDSGKKSYDYTTSKTQFVCIGRLAETKGQDIILKAIHHLNKINYLFNVDFIGSAADEDDFDGELENMSISLGIEHQVRWKGFSRNVFSEVNTACALLCSSHIEPLGRVIFEAWDMGLIPIVWQGSGGGAEIIKASGGGVLYSNQTGESIGMAMKRVSEMSQEENNMMIENGRRWLKFNCGKDSYIEKLYDVWRAALK